MSRGSCGEAWRETGSREIAAGERAVELGSGVGVVLGVCGHKLAKEGRYSRASWWRAFSFNRQRPVPRMREVEMTAAA